jgi:hypothetical protein
MSPRNRLITYVTAAALVLATTLGCSALSSAKKLAGHAVELGKLTELMTNAEKLTYEAKYNDSTGTGQDIVAQAPPKVAYLSADTDYIFDGSNIYNCDTESNVLTCSKTADTDTADPDGDLAAGLGGTFFTGELGITLLAAALLVPQSNVKDSNQKIAGLQSTCISVSGLSGDTPASGASPDPDDFNAFSMCVGSNGVVTSFVGTDTSGKKTGITMTSFSSSVSPSVFGLPAGAVVSSGAAPTISAAPSVSAVPSAAPSAAPSASASASAVPSPSAS